MPTPVFTLAQSTSNPLLILRKPKGGTGANLCITGCSSKSRSTTGTLRKRTNQHHYGRMFVYHFCKLTVFMYSFCTISYLYPNLCLYDIFILWMCSNYFFICNFFVFYLQVVYLDFLNTGLQQLPPRLPHISVWKGDMIKERSKADCVQGCTYGTCQVRFFYILFW